jgi:uncharacterized protein YigE (DUF2233 family)
MAFDWEKNYSNDLGVEKNGAKEKSNLGTKKESKEQYEPLKVYEVKNIEDVWFGSSSKCFTEKDKLHFAVNGPLVWADWKPVGWYIDNGSKSKDFIEPSVWWWNFAVDNWVFWVGKDWKPYLIPHSELKNNSTNFKRAFQNWPMLIQNWKNLREKGTSVSEYNRSWIWFTPEWDMIVVYSDQPCTLKQFTKQFEVRWCNNAIYLDGWPYAWYEDVNGSHWKLNASATKLQFFHQN